MKGKYTLSRVYELVDAGGSVYCDSTDRDGMATEIWIMYKRNEITKAEFIELIEELKRLEGDNK